jgi:hypothetical protein
LKTVTDEYKEIYNENHVDASSSFVCEFFFFIREGLSVGRNGEGNRERRKGSEGDE